MVNVFLMKFKIIKLLLSESVADILPTFYCFFTKIIIWKVPWRNLSIFLNAVLEKFAFKVCQHPLNQEFSQLANKLAIK